MTGAYSYQIGGPPLPADVTNFYVAQAENNVVMSWDDINDPGFVGFDVLYGPQDHGIGSAIVLTYQTRATEITTSKIPPGSWRFWIRGVDIAGQTSANPSYIDFTVMNTNTVITEDVFIPSYDSGGGAAGQVNLNLFNHWTGVYVPTSQNTCDQYLPIDPPDTADVTLDTVPGGSFDETTYYFKFTYVTAGGETLPSSEMSALVPAGYLPTAFIPKDAFAATCEGWNVYVSDASGTETKQNTSAIGFITSRPAAIVTNQIDQIWQMPITGLEEGDALPTQNTTGWEVFNVFVPDPAVTCTFGPSRNGVDTFANADKRVWISAQYTPGPGQSDIPDDTGTFNAFESDIYLSSTAPAGLYQAEISFFVIGQVTERYISPAIAFNPIPGSVFFVTDFGVTVDNFPKTDALANVAISSSGTTVNFSDYGLAYHATPSVQVTPSSGTAVSGTAVATSSDVLVNLYTSSGGAVSGAANLSITGI